MPDFGTRSRIPLTSVAIPHGDGEECSSCEWCTLHLFAHFCVCMF